MRLLLDNHTFLELIGQTLHARHPKVASVISSDKAQLTLSVASLWEFSIEVQIGKLRLNVPLAEAADYARHIGIHVLPMSEVHAVAVAMPEPPNRDPFDRMLLGIAQAEGMKFVTADRALADHPRTARA